MNTNINEGKENELVLSPSERVLLYGDQFSIPLKKPFKSIIITLAVTLFFLFLFLIWIIISMINGWETKSQPQVDGRMTENDSEIPVIIILGFIAVIVSLLIKEVKKIKGK